MECEKFSLSVDVELSKESLRNAYMMLINRLPRKVKKRWKVSIAKRYGVELSQIKLKKDVVWEYIKSVEDLDNIHTTDKLTELKELVDATYGETLSMSTDTAILHKAMQDYRQFVIYEHKKSKL